MRLALLSDLHANLRAFQACLAHSRAQGAERIALLGDLVGYGAEPAEVVALARELVDQGAIVLQGNHDALAAEGRDDGTVAGAGARWTHDRLDAEQRAFLAALPLTAVLGTAFLVHATADAPGAWHYATTAPRVGRSLQAACATPDVRHVFGGHVHEQCLWYAGRHGDPMPFTPAPGVAIPLAAHRQWLATLGSVGQPRDGDVRAGYALFEPGPPARLTFHRVPYDHAAAAEAVRRSGLPAAFAQRLLEGR